MAERIYINDNWQFVTEYTDELLEVNYTGQSESVRLPHTCKETPYHYFDEHSYQMVCGYRKKLNVPAEWEGSNVSVTIEAAGHSAEVYLNGDKIGEHHCGYTAFKVDLTQKLHYGEMNVLVVKVDSRENQNIPPFGFVVDYMTYGGIYREVYIEVNNHEHIEDVFIKPHVDEGDISPSLSGMSNKDIAHTLSDYAVNGKIESEIAVHTDKYTDNALILRQSVYECHSAESMQMTADEPLTVYEIKADDCETRECELTKNGVRVYVTDMSVDGVCLWDVESPKLYMMKTELILDGRVLDTKYIRFGWRSAKFKSDGFYLNGRKMKLRGLNRHQSYPYVGYAMPESMQKMDADILKNELGLNAVRTSHYPQSHYFLDRCDEIGLLVFTEMPGWQHIGDSAWKKQAVENVKDMVIQYRNHISIILWGVRINESPDDDEFYKATNEAAHSLDETRQTGGVRCIKNSNLLEDVYTYNDFVHDGKAPGCEPKNKVTSNTAKAYLISEYNGHMYPTKTFDWEEHRAQHALRHVNVLDAVAAQEEISGSFGWCMFDYNTHKDFGSGDRICYHGVLDMYRNPKMAAAVYSCMQDEEPVLEISSSMDIGEHPACNRGDTYIFTNADSVRMYKNDVFIKEYTHADTTYTNIKNPPIIIDDYIGTQIEQGEKFKKPQAEAVKYILNHVARYGYGSLPPKVMLKAARLIIQYHMKPDDAYGLYGKYIGDWGGASTVYRFEAVKEGKIVKTVVKEPMTSMHLMAQIDHSSLVEKSTYDVAAIRIQAQDENDNILPFYQGNVHIKTEGPVEIIGPADAQLRGGLGGTYIRTTGESGHAVITLWTDQTQPVQINVEVNR